MITSNISNASSTINMMKSKNTSRATKTEPNPQNRTKMIGSRQKNGKINSKNLDQKNQQKDSQESVRMSLVSLDKANVNNPQYVAHYCRSIFEGYLREEVK